MKNLRSSRTCGRRAGNKHRQGRAGKQRWQWCGTCGTRGPRRAQSQRQARGHDADEPAGRRGRIRGPRREHGQQEQQEGQRRDPVKGQRRGQHTAEQHPRGGQRHPCGPQDKAGREVVAQPVAGGAAVRPLEPAGGQRVDRVDEEVGAQPPPAAGPRGGVRGQRSAVEQHPGVHDERAEHDDARIQNAHAANISFLGVHLVLPLAAALLLAAIAGALLMAAAGPARVTQLRQITRRALRKARAG